MAKRLKNQWKVKHYLDKNSKKWEGQSVNSVMTEISYNVHPKMLGYAWFWLIVNYKVTV